MQVRIRLFFNADPDQYPALKKKIFEKYKRPWSWSKFTWFFLNKNSISSHFLAFFSVLSSKMNSDPWGTRSTALVATLKWIAYTCSWRSGRTASPWTSGGPSSTSILELGKEKIGWQSNKWRAVCRSSYEKKPGLIRSNLTRVTLWQGSKAEIGPVLGSLEENDTDPDQSENRVYSKLPGCNLADIKTAIW